MKFEMRKRHVSGGAEDERMNFAEFA